MPKVAAVEMPDKVALILEGIAFHQRKTIQDVILDAIVAHIKQLDGPREEGDVVLGDWKH